MSIRDCKACDGNGFVFVNCGCREAMCPHTPWFGGSTDPRPGIYEKFRVRRTDGSSGKGCKHENCDYFVLDWVHDPFAIPAAMAYAAACEAEYPDLALDLRARAKEAKR